MSFVIDVQGLRKSFGAIEAVKDFSIQLTKGRIFGFLGPNGSGKTTTIRMLCGLLKADAGSGQCLGYDLIRESEKIKASTGYMTQRFSLYEDLTIQENLELIARIYQMPQTGQAVLAALQQLNLFARRLQKAGTLSGGLKQRLALAACTIHNPPLLLLDEPTSGVDPQSRRDFWDYIHHLADKGTTILVSTHYMDEVERCHEIAYIFNGQLLTKGTVDDVLAHSGMITWIARGQGPDLSQLALQLKNQPGVEEMSFMGEALRVSSTKPARLTKTLQPFQKNRRFQWEKTTANAEDLFLLMARGHA